MSYPIAKYDIEDGIEFNREVEEMRGRDPFDVFLDGNCGFHHYLLKEIVKEGRSYGNIAIPYLCDGYNGPHVVTRVRNIREGFDLGFFSVCGEIDDPRREGFCEKISGPIPNGLLYGYRHKGDNHYWYQKEECRMTNNMKLMRLFIKERNLGTEADIDIERELHKLGDHLI